jgi:putative NIF3 family GTP cyclohydrolase 1 type 2
VAVCGGAGDFLLDTVARTDADVYVTSDLRHHPASEFVEAGRAGGGPALIDASHWATEWPWLADAATRLTSRLGAKGTTVETRVSDTVTDAWTTTAHSPGNGAIPDPTRDAPHEGMARSLS